MSPTVTIIISATVGLISPLIALEVEKWLDSRHESRSRKLTIFKNLMAYRATLLSPQFVQSLNLVDLEFNGKSAEEKDVRDKWKILLDHYNNYAAAKEPVAKSQDLTIELLKAMSKYFNYDFDEVYLKRGAYYPKYFADVEQDQNTLRIQLLELLRGDRRLPVGIFEQKFPDPADVPPKV